MPQIRFFEQNNLAQCFELTAVPGPYEKLDKIICNEDPADMSGYVSCFAGTVIANGRGGYYWYYSALGMPNFSPMRINLAQSDDGVTWHKVPLGQEIIDGRDSCRIKVKNLPPDANYLQPIVHRLDDGRWRMYFWLHRGGEHRLVRYLTAHSDDGLQWTCDGLDKVCVYHPSDAAVPGFDWTSGLVVDQSVKSVSGQFDMIAAKRRLSNDATFVVRNPAGGLWEMYTVWLLPNPPGHPRRCEHDNAPAVLRTIQRRTSQDGLQWSDPQLILAPDENDPLDQQFYHLAVQWFEGRRLGFLGNYRLDEQTMDMELCFSADGTHWHRPLRGPWIQRGNPGDFNAMGIYPVHGIIPQKDHWLVPYNAINLAHNAFCGNKSEEEKRALKASMFSGGCIARFHRDRFLGLQTAGALPGLLQTKPFIKTDRPLALDAAICGTVRYSLCDAFGTPIPGYAANECIPLSGDSHQHRLAWKAGKSADAFTYDAMTLRLELREAVVYTIHY